MLSINTLKSASDATKYYAGYYEQGKFSSWHGNGAKLLGLQGEIQKDEFVQCSAQG